jgi:hypothetical protein
MFILAGNVVACGTPSSMITFDGVVMQISSINTV